jgi:predicted RNA binding protein YcfA (HicA-like mRNA interferase family)
MRLPRDLSGAALIAVLRRLFGYRQVGQEGSHVILQSDDPRHRLAVPDHRVLRLGTLNAILRSVARAKGIDKADILARV